MDKITKCLALFFFLFGISQASITSACTFYLLAQEPNGGADALRSSDRGDDVYLSNMAFELPLTLLEIPGRGMNWSFQAVYKNNSFYKGPLGYNWDFNYNIRLELNIKTGDITLKNGLGRADTFKNNSTGYEAPEGFYAKITPDTAGTTIRDRNGLIYRFGLFSSPGGSDSEAAILEASIESITDRNQNAITFNYRNNRTLKSINDTLGRFYNFTYDRERHITKITDFGGRQIKFDYDANDDLVAITTPAVTGTPNGNDFPNGKTIKFTYRSGSNCTLDHNLLSVIKPNEAMSNPQGAPSLVNTYGEDPQDEATYERIITQQLGGTNQDSADRGLAPAGGNYNYFFQTVNDGADPDDLTVVRSTVTVIDRNGNAAIYEHNVKGNRLRYIIFTGRIDPNLPRAQMSQYLPVAPPNPQNPLFPQIPKLRAEDPEHFITTYAYNKDGLMTRITHPEGNETLSIYDETNPDRLQQGNLLKRTDSAGPRGGDGNGSAINDIVTTYTYESIYNQTKSVTDSRGNDASYVPPIDPGATGPSRYTTSYIFDYQEGPNEAALAAALGITVSEVQNLLAAAGITMNLGDLNGDGATDQIGGNIIRVDYPTVHLTAGSQQAQREGDLTQEIFEINGHNSRGQPLFHIDPDNSRDEYKYYPETNPGGRGGIPADADTYAELGGYLGRTVKDTTALDNFDATALNIASETRYDKFGNIISKLDGRGILTKYVINQRNQIIRTTRAADVSASTETGLIAFAYTVTNFYDANDNLIQVDVRNKDGDTDSNASLTTIHAHDILDDLIETATEVDTNHFIKTGYRYDAHQNLIRTIEPLGNFHDTIYDERNLVFTKTAGANDPAIAATTRTTYDGNKQIKIVRDADDTNGLGGEEQTFFTYDGFDRLVKTLTAVGSESQSTYDPVSNILTTKARGFIGGPSPTDNSGVGNVDLARSSALYDELNRTIRTDAEWFVSIGASPVRPPLLGDGLQTTVTEYDRSNRVTRSVNDNSHDATMEYDGVDRLLRSEDALQNEARMEYDPNSNVVTLTSTERRGDDLNAAPETFVAVNRHDSLNRLRFTADNANQVRRIAYDSRDNVTQTSDAQGPVDLNDPELGFINRSGNTVRYFYDGLSRKVKAIEDIRIGGAGDGSPSLDGPVDPNVDPANLDTTNPDNPDGKITEISVWDDNSRLVLVADDNDNATTYEYDALNRKTREIFSDGTMNLYGYDRDNNLKTRTDENGSVFGHSYDGANRRIQTTIARAGNEVPATTLGTVIDGTTLQTFEYDGLNRSTKITDNNTPASATDDSVVTKLYDSLSRQIEESQDSRFVSFDYDGLGNRIRLTYPNDRIVVFTFDALERLKTITGVVTNYSYIGPGRLLERTAANGTKLTYLDNVGAQVGYDGVKRLIRHRQETAADAAITDFTYGFNRENMRLFEHRLHQPVGSDAKGEAYTYDSLYRLMDFKVGTQTGGGAIAAPDTQTLYNLDGVGNRTFITKDAVTTTYAPNTMNEYDAVGGVTQVQDDNGNMKDDGTLLFSHDAFNRLITVTRKSDGLPIAAYAYDALNRRVTRDVTNSGPLDGLTRFLLSDSQEIEERDSGDVVLTQYVYGSAIDEILTMDRGGQTYYYHDDSLGSTEAMTDAPGAIVERTTYDAYGTPQFTDASFTATGATSSVGNPFLFTAQRLDSETGFYYYRNRYYNPATGRFIERDPLGYAAGAMGLYEYVGGDAINRVDPFGLEDEFNVTGEPRAAASGSLSPGAAQAEKLGRSIADATNVRTWTGLLTKINSATAKRGEGFKFSRLNLIDHAGTLLSDDPSDRKNTKYALLGEHEMGISSWSHTWKSPKDREKGVEARRKVGEALADDATICVYSCRIGLLTLADRSNRLQAVADETGLEVKSFTGLVFPVEETWSGLDDEQGKQRAIAEASKRPELKDKTGTIIPEEVVRFERKGKAVWLIPTGKAVISTPKAKSKKSNYSVGSPPSIQPSSGGQAEQTPAPSSGGGASSETVPAAGPSP